MHAEVKTELKHKILLFLFITIILLSTVLTFFYHYSPEGLDDAWITYRYARNLAEGKGYIYNPGEKIQGTSTPLFTLLLTLLALMKIDIPTASTAIALLSLCATNLILFFWLRRLKSSMVGLIGVALLLMTTWYMEIAVSGMETAAYCLLILLSFYLFFAGYNRLAFIAGGLGMWMRLDGIIILAVLAATYYWQHRRWPLKDLALPVAFNAIWFGFAQWYFGLTLPYSFLINQAQTGHQLISFWVLEEMMQAAYFYWLPAIIGMAYVVLTDKDRKLSPMVMWWGGYLLAYSFSQLGYYPWYFTPPLLALSFFAAYGLGSILENIAAVSYRQALTWGAICLIGLIPIIYSSTTWNRTTSYKALGMEKARYQGALFAASYIPDGAEVLTGGVGMIGWFKNNYMFDYAGLVSPQVKADKLPPDTIQALEKMVYKYQPRFVYHSVFSHDGWPKILQKNYRIVKKFPHKHPALTEFVLWERNLLASPE